MSFAHPWLLAALPALALLWWLLRITPPAARRQDFPAIGLLLGLESTRITAARTPWWLLALRLLAAGLAIVGFAGPEGHAPPETRTGGDMVLVIDNGWAAAPDWTDRLRAGRAALSQVGLSQAGQGASTRLLATAAAADGSPIGLSPAMPASDLMARLAALRPVPWPPDRAAAAAALAGLPASTRVVYLADGVAGADDPAFATAMRRFGRVGELRGTQATLLLRPPGIAPNQLTTVHAATLAAPAGTVVLRAMAADGTVLSTTGLTVGADGAGSGVLALPAELRARLASLRLGDRAAAGATVLLDGAPRRHPVGLLAAAGGQDQPLTGALFYVRRALAGDTELREGEIAALLRRPVAAIVAADLPIADPAQRAALTEWVRRGGMLIRFAGPKLAGDTADDALLPIPLAGGDRALGGTMSWSRPAALAAFAPTSPFAGLAVTDEVRVARQVLAQPGAADTASEVWASLADGTPLVTAARLGAGRLVLFHVTANADWSNLPLSGLFVDMLHRLVGLSAGVRPDDDDRTLAPRRVLDGFGQLGEPGAAARPVAGRALDLLAAAPSHPPGLYGPDDAMRAGPDDAMRALNLSAHLAAPVAEAPIPGASQGGLGGVAVAAEWGPALLAGALLLLLLDGAVALRLLGLAGAVAALLLIGPARADDLPSLDTHLAYVVTGDSQADGISQAGLQGLSDYVNQRTAAVLAAPVGVDPAHDDLSFYPLLYWPILADAPDPDGAAIARLDDYMENGGIIVFDTRDAGARDAQADAALRRIGDALAIPPLIRLSPAHVLSHSFYLLHDWPGRFAGAPVWVDRRQDHANDSVSPVIIGGEDWAAAWATDAAGNNPYDLDGGETQRVAAYRFGVNLVIYALTGNYKADQVHVPELLRRMGTDAAPDGGDGAPDPEGAP